MSPRRIAITGMGAVSALGLGAPALWQGMRDARSGIAPLVPPEGETGIRMQVAAAFTDYDPAAHFSSGQLTLLDRVSQFALLAAEDPRLGDALFAKGVQVAIDMALVRGDAVLASWVEVAFLPAMSGG